MHCVIGFAQGFSVSDTLPLQLKVYASITDVPAGAWDALVGPEARPFALHGWLSALEESGSASPETGWHPRHLTLWRGNRLIAAAPAYLKDHSHGEFVLDWSWATTAERMGIRYFPRLVMAIPFTPFVGQRVLVAAGEDRPAQIRALVRAALELARSENLSSIHCLFAADDELAIFDELGFAPRHHIQYHWRRDTETDFEGFLQRFHSKRRNQIRHERRIIDAQGLTITTRRGVELTAVDPTELFSLYRSTLARKVFARKPLTPRFFLRALERLPEAIEVVEARRKGELLAGAFNVARGDTLYGCNWGTRVDMPFLHFNVCLYHPVDECLRRGRSVFQPGAGGEHKLTRGFLPVVTRSAHWLSNAALDRTVRAFLDAERAAVQQGMPQLRAESGFKGY